MKIIEAAYPLPIRPSSDNIDTVLDSNFMNGRVFGNEIVPVDSLSSMMSDAADDQARVRDLAARMSGPDGYISRILVDPDGNIIEGQHRYHAVRQLGHTHIPITRIGEITHGFPVEAMHQAVKQAAPSLHIEQIRQVVAHVCSDVREVGSVQAVRDEFEFPRGWEAPFEAALAAIG